MAVLAKKVDAGGAKVGEVELPASVFGAPVRKALMAEVVVAHRAAARQGTACTKTRGKVRGGGRKPYKQKGTGNARAGSSRSPLWPGGGTVFGPTPRSYAFTVPKEKRRIALRSAFAQAQQQGRVTVVEGFPCEPPKTKAVAALMHGAGLRKVLFIDSQNSSLERASRNLKRAKYSDADDVSLLDILRYENLMVSEAALRRIEERLGQ